MGKKLSCEHRRCCPFLNLGTAAVDIARRADLWQAQRIIYIRDGKIAFDEAVKK